MGWLAGKDAGISVGWFGIDDDAAPFGGYGPSGVATFALDLEDGFTITYSWVTDVIPRANGTEQRISILDRPKQAYKGTAKQTGTGPRQTRARMARYATAGAEFLLGLPHEAMPLVGDNAGAQLVVPAAALAQCDWQQPGQRVIVHGRDGTSVGGILQSAAAGGSMTIDADPGVAGLAYGWVMPAMAVLLDPQQNFNRYPTNVDEWEINARAAIFDFAPAPTTLDLSVATGDPALAGALLTLRRRDAADYLFNLANASAASLNEAGPTSTVFYKHDITTLSDVAALLGTSDNYKLTGAYNPAAVITIADGGTWLLQPSSSSGAMGTGAALTMYDGHPVWDRELVNDGTIQDTVQALTQILDLDGVPLAVALADDPQFGRTVAIESTDPAEWQWLKLFLCTVRGPQSVWWLPTWSPDLTWVSSGASSIVVRTDDESDVLAWYPQLRDRMQIRQIDGTITYAQITGTPVDHGDGTQTIAIDVTLSGVAVDLISWLEPCRFESDDFPVTFKRARGFTMQTLARAHSVRDTELLETE